MGSAQMQFELRFQPLATGRPGYSFPCDGCGRVDMDDLSDRERNDYLFARGSVGYALEAPVVCGCAAN
jgi:hypothetical protein